MKPILIAGVTIVHLALISYTIAIITLHRKRHLTKQVMWFLSLGVIFDITSTICMVISSGNAMTLHGFVGYTSLTGMLIDTLVSFRKVKANAIGVAASPSFIRWSTVAYSYWILAYITGALIVALR